MSICRDTEVVIPIEWYWCAPDAKIYPHYHRFASGVWASDRINWTGVGEVGPEFWKWSNGKTIKRLPGTRVCGELEQFQNGALETDIRICTDDTGFSSCCPEFREWWCCDFLQLPLTSYAVTLLEERNPIPPEFEPPTTDWRMTNVDVPGVLGWFMPFTWSQSAFCQAPYIGIDCNVHDLRVYTTGVFQTVTNAEQQWGKPFGLVFKDIRPFESCIPPYNQWSIDILVGTQPPTPPPPIFVGIFPPGFFPAGFFPPHFF